MRSGELRADSLGIGYSSTRARSTRGQGCEHSRASSRGARVSSMQALGLVLSCLRVSLPLHASPITVPRHVSTACTSVELAVAPPDFGRRVNCILGMPFDTVGLDDAVDRLRAAVRGPGGLFFSTPNLSYVSAVRRSALMRDSVIRSGMSVPDGMPLIWAAKLMGVRHRGRVAGSTIFDRVRQTPAADAPPIKVFFFGGQDGVAEQASDALNGDVIGAECVGYASPGFGTVEEMSREEWLAPIRESGADLLVVSIGTEKGQDWILRNFSSLKVPAVAYLGAVVNFVAGTVRRAPKWFRAFGLEWLWRIKEEPALWRRYASDAWTYARLVFGRVLYYRWHSRRARTSENARAVFDAGAGDGAVLTIEGAWRGDHAEPLRIALAQAAACQGPLRVDLDRCEAVDAEIVALLAMLWGHRRALPWPCRFLADSKAVRRVVRSCCADYIFTD